MPCVSPKLAPNGFSYAEIETSKLQRVKRVLAELDGAGSLEIGEIKKICGYTQNNTALDLAVSFVHVYPNKFYFDPVPKRMEKRYMAEIEAGRMRKKAFKTEPIALVKK